MTSTYIKKCVRFCDESENTAYDDKLTIQQRKCLCYSASELRNIRKEVGSSIRNETQETINFSSRGLEHLLIGSCSYTQERYYVFTREFLTVQFDTRRRRGNENDTTDLRQRQLQALAEAHSKVDRQVARLKGKRDEAEANQIYKEANLSLVPFSDKPAVPKTTNSLQDFVRVIFPLHDAMVIVSSA